MIRAIILAALVGVLVSGPAWTDKDNNIGTLY
jgi:hypothetical protein